MPRLALLLLLVPISALAQTVAPPVAPLAQAKALYDQGKFTEAAAAYRKVLEQYPKSAPAHAGLIHTLLQSDDVDAADEAAALARKSLPDSAPVLAAHGDLQFRHGLIEEAEHDYRAALKIDETCARGWFGLGRVAQATSRAAVALENFTRAHSLDPDDGDILYRWAVLLLYPQNVAELERHQSRYHSDSDRERREREFIGLLKALAGKPVWVPTKEVRQADLKLETISTPRAVRGDGVRVRLNDAATATLLVDSGADWITIPRKLAKKIGARKIVDYSIEGSTGPTPAPAYYAWVDKVTVGETEFRDCVVHVSADDPGQLEDGIIGVSIFSAYLVTLDFPARRLRLTPLPPARADQKDALVDPTPATPQSTTQFIRFGHLVLVPTHVNNTADHLFILDTGANGSSIDLDLARRLGPVRDSRTIVTGGVQAIEGVPLAQGVRLQFSSAPQPPDDIPAFSRRHLSKAFEAEVSGFLGLAAFRKMKVTLNYRDGLVTFDDQR